MLLIVVLCLSLIVQNLWENELFITRSNLALKNVLSAYGYSVRPVFLVLFYYLTQPKGKKCVGWVLVGINATLYCSSPFTKLCFEIREMDYASLRGPMWHTCSVISAILLAQLVWQTIIRYRNMRKCEQLIPLFIVMMITASVALDYMVGMERQPIAFLTISIVVGSVFYYTLLHLQFVREHERDSRQ